MLLITGSEGGLGKEIADMWEMSKGRVFNIPGAVIKSGKAGIDREVHHATTGEYPITHVINNFGINHLSKIGETPYDDIGIMVANLMAPYWLINALVASGSKPCKVINVASATYRVAQTHTALYSASKAGLVQLTKVMARELAPKGWVINAVAPGFMPGTRMSYLTMDQILEMRGWTQEEADEYANRLIPMGRSTSTCEVTEAILKIFELPSYINGTCIDIMGGS